MENLAELLAYRRQTSGTNLLGLIEQPRTYSRQFDTAMGIANALLAVESLGPGRRAALVGANSDAYLVMWMALQLAGIEAALINPTYPAELLTAMLEDLDPCAVLWVGEATLPSLPGVLHIDCTEADQGALRMGQDTLASGQTVEALPGFGRARDDIAGYMHTSGTTGRPKFCAQSHEYFLGLGRFMADRMALSPADTVFAPLPLFHINPLGYGVIAGIAAGANVLSAARFSVSRFWPAVVEHGVTALILHRPPAELLLRAKERADARGHSVRICFYAVERFLDEFEIPLGVSGYGSTEAAGISHTWLWRRGETVVVREGWSQYGGVPRPNIAMRISPSGEIQLRSDDARVLFSGYWRGGELSSPFDSDGWYSTGDLGRVDESGNLIFVERLSESIRVMGEYVPVDFVESKFAGLAGIRDAAVWREQAEAGEDVVTLFVSGELRDADALRSVSLDLPKFMRPATVIIVEEIPRDGGVGKVQRRQLEDQVVLGRVEL